jgi:hypothetical protein
MKFMVIESFKPESKNEIYKRYNEKGRMLPDGLYYIDSWLTEDGMKCFQLMETDNIELFDEWFDKWSDLTEFELIPVKDSPTKSAQPCNQADGK